MIKVGDKVYHWQTINKTGIVTEVITDSNKDVLTVGGTTSVRVYYRIRYSNNDGTTSEAIHLSGEVMKHFD